MPDFACACLDTDPRLYSRPRDATRVVANTAVSRAYRRIAGVKVHNRLKSSHAAPSSCV